MKILILNPYIPYPVNSGGRLRTWRFITALKERHMLSLLCPPEKTHSDALTAPIRGNFENLWVSGRDAGSNGLPLGKRIKNLLGGVPWEITYPYSRNLNRLLLEVMREHRFDAVFARYISAGKYLIENIAAINARVIVDLDDIEFIKSSRQMGIERTGGYAGFRMKLNNLLLKRYHRKLRSIDRVLVCSEDDRRLLRESLGLDNISVIPNAIEVSRYAQMPPYTQAVNRLKTLLFCGTLNYAPNVDGLMWFVKEVFPLILAQDPGITLNVIGSSKRDSLPGVTGERSIACFFNVPDVIPYYAQSSAVIVPLRVGGGTRIKILEAFACGRPVVTTPIGGEGLEMTAGVHCLTAAEPRDFAAACLRLLGNFDEAERIARESRIFVRDRFDTPAVDEKIRALFA